MCAKSVRWIVEKETWHPKEEENLKQAFAELGIPYYMCTSEFFSNGDPDRFFSGDQKFNEFIHSKTENHVLYGSLQLQNSMCCLPELIGCYCTMHNYACHIYYPKLGKLLLNSDYMMFPFSAILDRQERFFYDYGDCVFIRPDSGNKPFTGDVFHRGMIEEEIKLVKSYADIDEHTMVLVAPFHKIIREWRFIVVEKKIVANCIYKSDILADSIKNPTESEFTEGARKLAEKAAGLYQPDQCFVVDICQTDLDAYPHDLHVLELNAFSTSALYDCDAKAVVSAVTKVAEEYDRDEIYKRH